MLIYVAGFWLLLTFLTALAWLGRDTAGHWTVAFREPETGVAALLMAAAVLTVVLRPAYATRFDRVDIRMLAVDLGLVVGLTTFAVRSGRWWVLSAAALQLISTTAHMTRAMTPGMWRLGYQVMEEASSYPTLLLLAWGVWSRRRSGRSGERSKSFFAMRNRHAGRPR